MIGFGDSDLTGDLNDRKSTTWYVFMLGTTAVSWALKKQSIIILSSIEAKYVAATFGACQAIWIRKVLEKLRIELKKQ